MNNDFGNIADQYFSGKPITPPIYIAEQNPQQEGMNDQLSQGLRADGNIDIEGFSDKVKDLLDDSWEDEWGTFTMEEPTGNDPESVNLPVISFGVVDRASSKNKKGLKSRQNEYMLDPEDENYTIIISRKWFDCIVEYMVFHKTNKESRELLKRFEVFMETYTGYFKEQGVSEMVFLNEVDSRLSKKYKEGIPSTCIRYLMVLERITIQRVRTTKYLRSKIKASWSGSSKEQGLISVDRKNSIV